MANTIKHKRSATASAIPSTANLQLGELAINTYDGKVFLKKNDGIDAIVELSLPAGSIQMFAGASAPTGWLLCDGGAVNTYTYRVLHKLISNTYGGTAYSAGVTDASNALTTFNLPDLRKRFPVGKGASESLGGSDGLAYASRSLTHTHDVGAHFHGMGTGADLSVDIAHTHAQSAVSGSVGGSDGTHSHTITDPGHTHQLDRRASATAFGNNISVAYPSATGNAGNIATDSRTTGITVNTGGGHGHSFSLNAAGQTLATTNKLAKGNLGEVTGGEDGNAGFATSAESLNYLVLNYIIKF